MTHLHTEKDKKSIYLSMLHFNRVTNYSHHMYESECRCLDRVAIIIVPNLTPKEQKLDRWKLCSVIEVQEAEIFFLKIPLRLNFAMCGVVTSMEGTYCMEQGNKMNPYLGKLQFPLFDEI